MKLSKLEGVEGQVVFECPGCECLHTVWYGPGNPPRWEFNNDFNKPTFKPSILVRHSRMTAKGKADYDLWSAEGCPSRGGVFESEAIVCHSFVTNGKIQFLNDCSHKLKGSTVDLPELDL